MKTWDEVACVKWMGQKLQYEILRSSRELNQLAASFRWMVTKKLYWPLVVMSHTYQFLQ